MLNKEICKRCINLGRIATGLEWNDLWFAENEKGLLTKDGKSTMSDDQRWENGKVWCRNWDASLPVSIKRKPPKHCGYVLEHLLMREKKC